MMRMVCYCVRLSTILLTGRTISCMRVSNTVQAAHCRAGIQMIWEWQLKTEGGQWVVTVGLWHAAVQWAGGARVLWQATSHVSTSPEEQYTSPTYADAMDARAWCFRKMAEVDGQAV